MGSMRRTAVQQRQPANQLCCQGCSVPLVFRQNACVCWRSSYHSEACKYCCRGAGDTRLCNAELSSRRGHYRLRYRRNVANKCWLLGLLSDSYNLGNLATCPSDCVSHEDVGGYWGDCHDKPIYFGRGKIDHDSILKTIRTMALYVVFFVLVAFVQASIMWSGSGTHFGCSVSGAPCAGRFLLRWGPTEVSVPFFWGDARSSFAVCGSSPAEIDTPREQRVCLHAENRRYPPCASQVVER